MDLREALEAAEEFYEHDWHLTFEPALMEAARSLLEGREGWWCERHGLGVDIDVPEACRYAYLGLRECRMVPVRVVPVKEQK